MLDDEEHRQSGEGVWTPPFGWRRKNDKGGQGKATPMLSQESLVREILQQYSNQRDLSDSLNDSS